LNQDLETALSTLTSKASASGLHAPARILLVVRQSDRRLETRELVSETEEILGRGPGVSWVVDDKRVSRRHVRLAFASDQLIVQDLNSRNGTFLNGVPVVGSGQEARGGDVVRIGDLDVCVASIGQVASKGGRSLGRTEERDDVLVAAPAMKQVMTLVGRLATTRAPVLILGESGAGKQLVAEQIHRSSERRAGPFVRINCAAIPDNLFESELFGYERGAFTGADKRKPGFVEMAREGTLFLDEIGEMSLVAQAKLLVALDEGAIVRLGSTKREVIDTRFVCATNRDLRLEASVGRFRQDLYFRLSALTVHVPPLRERPVEIALLAREFLGRLARERGVQAPAVDEAAQRVLETYPWPGNVRELKNAIEHAFLLCDSLVIRASDLPATLQELPLVQASVASAQLSDDVPRELPRSLERLERQQLEAAMVAEGGNQTRAARRLGLSRRNLVFRLDRHGLSRRFGAKD